MNEKSYSDVVTDLKDFLSNSNIEDAKKNKIEFFLRTMESGHLADVDENIKKIGVQFVHEIILLEGWNGFSVEVMMMGGVFPKVEIGCSLAFFTMLSGLVGLSNTICGKEIPFMPVFIGIIAFHLLAFGASLAFERHIITPEKNLLYPGFFAQKGINNEVDRVRKAIADLFGLFSKNEIEETSGSTESVEKNLIGM